MTTPSWETLDPQRQARAQEMIRLLRRLDIPNAEEIVRGDLDQNEPRVASEVLLHDLWSEINAWRDNSEEWIPSFIDACAKDPESSNAGAGVALERMLAAGIDPVDVGRLARMVAYKSMFHFLRVLEEGSEAEVYKDLPGWKLAEIDERFQETGRQIRGLHRGLAAREEQLAAAGNNQGEPATR